MKLGVAVGFEDSIDTIVTVARDAEAAGAHSVHVVEAARTAVVPAAAVIGATERVVVGTYVLNAYAREPWLAGLVGRDLDELSQGRLVLGIGTGNVHFNQWYMGIDSSKPIAKLGDYLDIVRAVVAGEAGRPVRYQGDNHQIRWRATFAPARPTVPVLLAASGPNMIRLAGAHADGVAVGIMASVDFMNDVVKPRAREGAEQAGRNPEALVFPMGALVSVNADREQARDATKAWIAGLFHPVPHPYYDSQLRQLGYAAFADQASALMPQGKVRETMDLVPDEVIDTMTITGSPDQCRHRFGDYEGVADEIIAFRVPQPGDPAGPAAYGDLLALLG